jgi:hypothetical protein
MKYGHIVKHKGVWYAAGEEVPDSNGKKAYTKSEIARMPVDELRQLALKVGIDGAAEMNGTELKQYILSAFGM